MSRMEIIAIGIAALGVSTLAAAGTGSWPQMPSAKPAAASPATSAAKAARKMASASDAVNGFEYIGGEGGWQLVQHHYVMREGKLVHSDECDHVIRAASAAPTMDELETLRRRYPGG